jgi:hypothetical protein
MPPEHKKWDGDIHDDPKMIVARMHVINALKSCPEQYRDKLKAKVKHMPMCGHYVKQLIVNEGHVVGVIRSHCECRGCAVCDTLRAARTKRWLKMVMDERFDAGARFSLITLTIPHKRSDDLGQLLDWLRKAVARFQRSAAFRRHAKGWVRAIEIPWNEKNGFNPHIHYMVEADLWPMEEIKALWTRCMAAVGGPAVPAHGSHVKELRDRGKGLDEVVGYPFKIHDLSEMPPEELCRLLAETKGRHLAQMCRAWSDRVAYFQEQEEGNGKVVNDAQGNVLLTPHELVRQVNGGNRLAFDLLVEAARKLARSLAHRGLAARMVPFLRAAAEEHGWPVPELSVEAEGGSWLEP